MLPQGSFRRRVGIKVGSGQVSWLSGHRRTLSLPIPDLSRSVAVRLWRTKRARLADHSGGTAAGLHGFSFSPVPAGRDGGTAEP